MNQPSLPFFGRRRTDRAVVQLGPRASLAVRFVREPRARRYLLRVEGDGSLRVTIPRGGSRGEAEAFIARSRAWVERQRYLRLKHASRPAQLQDGTVVFVGGEQLRLSVREVDHRQVATLGALTVDVPAGVLDLRPFVQHTLRRFAATKLPARLHDLARQHSLPVGRVTVRNQRSRWGSCSPEGAIALNWRLVQMPPRVRDYVLLHELMHLRERNHSARFWARVAEACPWHREARAWLKAHEHDLM
jgi:hypothetical protein